MELWNLLASQPMKMQFLPGAEGFSFFIKQRFHGLLWPTPFELDNGDSEERSRILHLLTSFCITCFNAAPKPSQTRRWNLIFLQVKIHGITWSLRLVSFRRTTLNVDPTTLENETRLLENNVDPTECSILVLEPPEGAFHAQVWQPCCCMVLKHRRSSPNDCLMTSP